MTPNKAAVLLADAKTKPWYCWRELGNDKNTKIEDTNTKLVMLNPTLSSKKIVK